MTLRQRDKGRERNMTKQRPSLRGRATKHMRVLFRATNYIMKTDQIATELCELNAVGGNSD